MADKKYHWLKLPVDFFKDRPLKKLKKMAGGAVYTIIYQKLLLLSLENEGNIYFQGVEDNFEEEMSLELDETTEDIQMTILFLQKNNLIENIDSNTFFMCQVPEMLGRETDAAKRKRKSRMNQKLFPVTMSQSDVTLSQPVTNGHTEKEKEKEKEKDIEKEKEKEVKKKTSLTEKVFSDDANLLINLFINSLKNIDGKIKIPQNLEKWKDSMRLLIEKDMRTTSEIEIAIKFAHSNDFWKTNILSVPKLREKFQTLILQSSSSASKQAKKNINSQYDSTDEQYKNLW